MAKNNRRQFQQAWYQAWINDGDEEARILLIESCMGLVRQLAAKLRWAQSQEDLEAEGRLAILEALERYDPARGPFSACARLYIWDRLLELTRTSGHAVVAAQSRPEKALRFKLPKRVSELEASGYSRNEAVHVAAHEFRVTPGHAADSLSARSALSLSMPPAGDDDDRSLQIATRDEEVEQSLDRGRVAQLLREAISGLDDRERDIVTRRTFFEGRQPSQDSIAAEYGVSRERISQIEIEAMRHMRLELERRGLGLEDLL
ncbi:sigma-70 family RNA polymerase sigma factor [Sagittula sp. MA-2]|uniref:sigma-70 family RNA polymerase sigma factor n=1 Tax=Sagittula sp. MA-2 TaxID=3048007 RepID=UPI0024C39F64|nr:sigma-70 family RNA polymerase sigma factor [Sagittula sp. MA-2]WHZ36522.1 sigma-70 family RNA polymerase sigma factor [Sagittula sp. MA-2]